MLKSKVREWGKRYMALEVAGTLTALLAAWSAHAATGNVALSAIAGTVGENVSYYGFAFLREAKRYFAIHRHQPAGRRGRLVAWHTTRDLATEFGVAELLDSGFIRPGLMYLMPQVIGSFGWGIVAGKLLADVVFYGFAIVGYELKKRVFAQPTQPAT